MSWDSFSDRFISIHFRLASFSPEKGSAQKLTKNEQKVRITPILLNIWPFERTLAGMYMRDES